LVGTGTGQAPGAGTLEASIAAYVNFEHLEAEGQRLLPEQLKAMLKALARSSLLRGEATVQKGWSMATGLRHGHNRRGGDQAGREVQRRFSPPRRSMAGLSTNVDSGDHLSAQYHEALCRIGAKLFLLARRGGLP
jgi:hypothetical protein